MPPLPLTALGAGQHLPDVGLAVFPFRCPVPVNDLLVVVIVIVAVIVVVVLVVVTFVVVVLVIVIVILILIVLTTLCPVIVPLPPINRAVTPLVIVYQLSSLLLEPS